MANALVQPYQAGTQKQFSCALYDPRWIRNDRSRFWRIDVPGLRLANALWVPGDRSPARGWVLLLRSDYVNLNPNATNLQLQLYDGVNPVLVLGSLAMVQAQCVSRGPIAQDPKSVMLVELTDRRGVLWNKWFKFPITTGYNVRSPAYPEQYYSFSLNGSSPWTWSQMVQNVWNQMGTFLGPWPGLPPLPPPGNSPESWWFPGCSCWEALNDILDHLGDDVAVDLTQANPYTIVQGGADDPAFAALVNKYPIEDEMEYVDVGAARAPGKVKVFFHRRNQYYGTEETVRRDGLQWTNTTLYSVTITSPAPFSSSPGIHYLWSDNTVRFDTDGAPLPADVSLANAVAQQEVTQYFNRIYRSTSGFMHKIYPGALPFFTGSKVDGVLWRQDFRHRERMSWMTEISRGYDTGWPSIGIPGDESEMPG